MTEADIMSNIDRLEIQLHMAYECECWEDVAHIEGVIRKLRSLLPNG